MFENAVLIHRYARAEALRDGVLIDASAAAKEAGNQTSALGSDQDAESRELDRHLQNTEAHRELLDRLSADLIAGPQRLPEAADLLADFSRRRTGDWLRDVGRRYPGRSEEAAVACALVYFTLFRLHDGNADDEETARRLAAEYRACYGGPLTLPSPGKGAAIPPCSRAVAPSSALPPSNARRNTFARSAIQGCSAALYSARIVTVIPRTIWGGPGGKTRNQAKTPQREPEGG
jgi:hypothetical protein